MEGFGFLIPLLIFLGFRLVRFMLSEGDSGFSGRLPMPSAKEQIRDARNEGLTIRCVQDQIVTDTGEKLPIARVEVTGAIVVPKKNQPCVIRVWMLDVTNGDDVPAAVFCMAPDLADQDGVYICARDAEIPYTVSRVRRMVVGIIPMSALLLPLRGRRKVKILVAFSPPENLEIPYSYAFGAQTIEIEQESLGYLEFKDRDIKQERAMAMLALSISAVDGTIDKRETAVIRRFFGEHLAGRTDEEERKQRVTRTLKDTVASFQQGKEKPVALIKRLCEEIRNEAESDPSLAQAAYELCVQVAAADNEMAETEKKGLKYIAHQFKLPETFVREVHDRNIKLAMYDEADDEALLDMPKGLSDEQKIDFLNQEYRKWRARASHKDPDVATEANLRLQQITRARRELQEVS